MQAAEERSYCPKCNAVFRTPFSRCPLDGTMLAELTGDPLIGSTLDKRYIVEECIGEGGMGRVYRAKHTRMSRSYAIKVLFGDHAGDTRMRSRFAREAEAVSRLSHANVISVVDFGETEEGLLYLVMDLASGRALNEVVREQAPMPATRAVDILAQLSKGLAHAHAHGLVHRDFKCENVIMVIEEDVEVPKIVDFGICMIVEDAPSKTMLTSNGMIMGTPAVMAPEQASGDEVDHRTDLFSLGIVGYQLLSGCLPFEGSPIEMARKNLYEAMPSITERSGVFVPPPLEAVIRKLTAKRPDDRYQSARDVLVDLRDLGISGDFNDWSTVTPRPHAERPASQNGPLDSQEGPTVIQGTPAQTPMVTEVPISSVKPRRRPLFAFVALAICVGGGVLFALNAGDTEPDAAKSKVVAIDGTDSAEGQVTTEGAEGAEGATETESESTTKPAAGENPEGENPEGENPEGENPEGENPEGGQTEETQTESSESETTQSKSPRDRAADRARAKSIAAAKARARKQLNQKSAAERAAAKEAQLLQKTRDMYHSVNRGLDALEREKGKAAAAALRADFRQISYSRLIRDASLRPVYHQSLVRLRGKIKAKRDE